MLGSWAGAMGHTQWMPEVWLNMGVDADGDGQAFRRSDRRRMRFAERRSTSSKRGRYRQNEGWGYEVRLSANASRAARGPSRPWQTLGVSRANGRPFPRPGERASGLAADRRRAVLSHHRGISAPCDPATRRTAARWPPSILPTAFAARARSSSNFRAASASHPAEAQELQRLLTARGFDTGGADGRIGPETLAAVRTIRVKVGIKPADGYAGLEVLARLRQSP